MTVATLRIRTNFKNLIAMVAVPVIGAAWAAFVMGAPLIG